MGQNIFVNYFVNRYAEMREHYRRLEQDDEYYFAAEYPELQLERKSVNLQYLKALSEFAKLDMKISENRKKFFDFWKFYNERMIHCEDATVGECCKKLAEEEEGWFEIPDFFNEYMKKFKPITKSLSDCSKLDMSISENRQKFFDFVWRNGDDELDEDVECLEFFDECGDMVYDFSPITVESYCVVLALSKGWFEIPDFLNEYPNTFKKCQILLKRFAGLDMRISENREKFYDFMEKYSHITNPKDSYKNIENLSVDLAEEKGWFKIPEFVLEFPDYVAMEYNLEGTGLFGDADFLIANATKFKRGFETSFYFLAIGYGLANAIEDKPEEMLAYLNIGIHEIVKPGFGYDDLFDDDGHEKSFFEAEIPEGYESEYEQIFAQYRNLI